MYRCIKSDLEIALISLYNVGSELQAKIQIGIRRRPWQFLLFFETTREARGIVDARSWSSAILRGHVSLALGKAPASIKVEPFDP